MPRSDQYAELHYRWASRSYLMLLAIIILVALIGVASMVALPDGFSRGVVLTGTSGFLGTLTVVLKSAVIKFLDRAAELRILERIGSERREMEDNLTRGVAGMNAEEYLMTMKMYENLCKNENIALNLVLRNQKIDGNSDRSAGAP